MKNSFLEKMARNLVRAYTTRFSIALFISILGFGLVGVNPVRAAIFGTNLILNGDAEAGLGAASDSNLEPIPPIPNWTVTSNFTAVQYGASSGFPLATDPGPVNRGINFFAGGLSNPLSSVSQVIDVSAGFGAIDVGNVSFNLSGFLGGFLGQNDNMVLQAIFRDAGDITLGNASIGPVTAANRGNLTGLLERSTSGQVPIGTRNILVQLTSTRTAGSYNDGYADNLSLVLTNTSIPEPSSVLGLLGIGALLLRGTFRSQR